jgi:hypothetical protein
MLTSKQLANVLDSLPGICNVVHRGCIAMQHGMDSAMRTLYMFQVVFCTALDPLPSCGACAVVLPQGRIIPYLLTQYVPHSVCVCVWVACTHMHHDGTPKLQAGLTLLISACAASHAPSSTLGNCKLHRIMAVLNNLCVPACC